MPLYPVQLWTTTVLCFVRVYEVIIDCIIDYFCTEPLKPLVTLHTPL